MTNLFSALGGLGIFLLGVTIMTDGLKGVAGDALRRALTRFTRSPSTGAVTGALSTAVLQSSSATTVAAVGFVGAGLLTYPQALGVIFGANVGTTITGWLVALIGFKLKLGSLVLPLILFGVLMKLFGPGRWKAAGIALAGFGLIFVGIDAMQAGMSSLQGSVTPDSFPENTWLGRVQLVLIGVAITLVTQSSSAGVAAALTAVFTGTIEFEQAAAMVIGMDVGTTATAMIATMGGAADTRRTGYSHVVYNLLTGLAAFLLLSPYVWLWQSLAPDLIYAQAEIALVAFHTSFNCLGLLLVLPVANQFSRLMFRLVPEQSGALANRLDKQLLKEPAVAIETAHQIQEELFRQQCALMLDIIDQKSETAELVRISGDLKATDEYLDLIRTAASEEEEWSFLVSCLHAQDHMNRLQHRLNIAAKENRILQHTQTWMRDNYPRVHELLDNLHQQGVSTQAEQIAGMLALTLMEQNNADRAQIMKSVALGQINSEQGDLSLESRRWLMRCSHHLARISHHCLRAQVSSLGHQDVAEPTISD